MLTYEHWKCIPSAVRLLPRDSRAPITPGDRKTQTRTNKMSECVAEVEADQIDVLMADLHTLKYNNNVVALKNECEEPLNRIR